METFPVLYKVLIWDEDERREKMCYGVTIAESYQEAITFIESYYGDTIIEISLYMNEENVLYEFNKEDKYMREFLDNC